MRKLHCAKGSSRAQFSLQKELSECIFPLLGDESFKKIVLCCILIVFVWKIIYLCKGFNWSKLHCAKGRAVLIKWKYLEWWDVFLISQITLVKNRVNERIYWFKQPKLKNCNVQWALVEENCPCKRLCPRVVFPLPGHEIFLKIRLPSIFIHVYRMSIS